MPDWTDNGFILDYRRHGENGIIVSLLTEHHGKHLGLIRSKTCPQIASFVNARWHARLSEHLGNYTLETTNAFSAQYLDDRDRLACLSTLCALLNESLPERESWPEFFHDVVSFLEKLDEVDWLKQYVLLEARLLSVLGFGMDLTKCAGGGCADNLAYVSPKTAKAVSLEMGRPYHEKLLPLPAFLYKDVPATPQDIQNGLHLTGYFLSQHVTLPRLRNQMIQAAR